MSSLIDLFLHLDVHLAEFVGRYGVWVYGLLFTIIFAETGLVVTPFLPGDSLLFAAGAIAATGALDIRLLFLLLAGAAILGNTVNYSIGHFVGPRVFRGDASHPLLNRQHLDRAHAFFEKYGGKTIIIARFVPIVRTFSPFVAGIGRMGYVRFISYSIFGTLLWVTIGLFSGYLFGNIPIVKKNFSIAIIAVVFISLLPPIIEYLRNRSHANKSLADDKKG